MNFKKRANDSWTDTPHYIHNTSTDTITTLPAVLYPTGSTATVGLKGQTVQSSTPSPTSPVIPQGTGERTGNLCLVSQSNSIYYAGLNKYSVNSNSVTVTGEALFGFICKASPNTDYTVSAYAGKSGAQLRIREYSDVPIKWNANFITQPLNKSLSTYADGSFVTDSSTNYLLVVFYVSSVYAPINIFNIMLNTGSEALPYEPYGNKIPISSASTTTNVYLGEVQTTRKIRKVVLDGVNDGEWKKSLTRNGSFYLNVGKNAITALGLCDRAINVGTVEQYDSIGKMLVESSGLLKLINLWLFDTNISLDDFKTYLQQQYANGTPVCVWYVLKTEETGIVNEPLMKIGGYADTVSGITIPTITGKDTFDVETTLKPSEVTLSYTGWHDATVKEWDGSQWNE